MVGVDEEKNVVKDEVMELVREVRKKYRFEFAGTMDVQATGACRKMAVTEKGILISDRFPDEDQPAAAILSRPLSGNAAFERILDEVPVGASITSICVVPEENTFIYPRLCGGSLLPVKHDPRSGTQTPFDPPPEGEYINIASIDTDGNTVIVTDVFAHLIAEYSIDGAFLRRIPFPERYEYPIAVERAGESSFLMAFWQDHLQIVCPQYSACDDLADSYLILVGADGRIAEDLTDISRWLFRREPIRALARDATGSCFILTTERLIKINQSFEKVFEVNLSEQLGRVSKSGRLSPGDTMFLDMKYFDGRLYLLQGKPDKRICVFGVG